MIVVEQKNPFWLYAIYICLVNSNSHYYVYIIYYFIIV